jgi:lysophospholipase L1-like esterase
MRNSLRFGPLNACTIALVITSLSCATPDRTPGTDYFRNDFRCKNEIHKESDPKFLLAYAAYRKRMFAEAQEGIKESFAVIAGESTAALFTDERVERYLPGIQITNRGIPGDTTALLHLRLNEDLISLNPSVIILAIGGNDILAGRCLTKILENISLILARSVEALPATRIYVVSIPPVVSGKANSITPHFNQALRALAESFAGVRYMDLWPILADTDSASLKREYRIVLPDGKTDAVHFNESGYKKWAELILPEMERDK